MGIVSNKKQAPSYSCCIYHLVEETDSSVSNQQSGVMDAVLRRLETKTVVVFGGHQVSLPEVSTVLLEIGRNIRGELNKKGGKSVQAKIMEMSPGDGEHGVHKESEEMNFQ